MSKTLVVFSGGQDSTTVLYKAVADRGVENVSALTIDYNQKNSIEIESALIIAKMVGIKDHEVLKIGSILQGTSPLTDPNAKLEEYESHKVLPGGLEKTFVPARNLLFMTLAANRAFVKGIDTISLGLAHGMGGYPDCRAPFIHALETTILAGLERKITFDCPLLYLSKGEAVDLARSLPGCYRALAYSHTAYDGLYPPTGHDRASLLRQKSFEEANSPDPLVVRAWLEGAMALPEERNYTNYSGLLQDLRGESVYEKIVDLEQRLRKY
jgi:7-cyano-7-deazaguanine synthase